MGEEPAFGTLLKRYRLAAGLTHEALAERAALSARAISDLERGVSRAPRSETLALLVQALPLAPKQRAALAAAGRPTTPEDASGPPHNLPIQLTSFIGRERELRTAADLLRRQDVRLLTVTGLEALERPALRLSWRCPPWPGSQPARGSWRWPQ